MEGGALVKRWRHFFPIDALQKKLRVARGMGTINRDLHELQHDPEIKHAFKVDNEHHELRF